MEASCCVARKIFLSPAIASSSARTLDSRPTTNGVIMYGKMTTSRMGIIGRRFVSDFSLEVSIILRGKVTAPQAPPALAPGDRMSAGLFQKCQTDFLREHHLFGHLKLAHLLIRR